MHINEQIRIQNEQAALLDYETFQKAFNALPDPILPMPSKLVPETEEI